jgi:hypothetical protein
MRRADRDPPIAPPRAYSLAELLGNPGLAVWCLTLILTPFYVVDSGLPQPGDALVIFLLPLSLARWDGRFDKPTSRMLRALLWFTAWVFVVNLAWALIQGSWENPKNFLIHPLFYAYNAAVLISALILARPNPARFIRLTVDVTLLMVLFQVGASFFYRTELYRGTLFFNSPNQLGYYSLLAAVLFAMTQQPLGLSRVRAALGVTGCAYLAVLSSSRASLAGILVLLLVLVFSNPRAVIIGSLVAVALTMLGGPLADALETSQTRTLVQHGGPQVGFAEERGYDRIWEYPEYLLLGAGEGDYARFAKPGQSAREIHSSLGTVVFGYGVIGVFLFMTFAVRMVRGGTLRTSIMMIPAVTYTVAHQGLRFTSFWVVVAAYIMLKQAARPPP